MRARSIGGSDNGGGLPGYLRPRKPPREWVSPDAQEEVFKPIINITSQQIIEEKRESIERYGEKPTRYMRPVDFVIYDP